MKITVNMLKGTFALTGDLTELARLSQAMESWKPEPAGPHLPTVHTYHVGNYTQVFVTPGPYGSFWVCSCDDFRFRRQSAQGQGAWLNGACKHIVTARDRHFYWTGSWTYSRQPELTT